MGLGIIDFLVFDFFKNQKFKNKETAIRSLKDDHIINYIRLYDNPSIRVITYFEKCSYFIEII